MITKEDLAAIKEARSIVIFWRPNGSEGVTSGIRMGYEVRLDADDAPRKLARVKDTVWTRGYTDANVVEYNRTIEATLPPEVTLYEQGDRDHQRSASEAVWVTTSFQFDHSTRSVMDLLKVGDEIGVHFVGSNNSDNTRAVNYHRDECYLRIKRKDKTWEFLIGVMVGPDNLARMVRHMPRVLA